jgi:hypothetical protein
MLPRIAIPTLIGLAIVTLFLTADPALAEPMVPPQAPAGISWFPHGYGETMWIQNRLWSRKKGAHGLRVSPSHIGSFSQPVWGSDVNGFYRGPQVPSPDPAMCQLPIGLIYPANGPALPPPRKVSKTARRFAPHPMRMGPPMRRY